MNDFLSFFLVSWTNFKSYKPNNDFKMHAGKCAIFIHFHNCFSLRVLGTTALG